MRTPNETAACDSGRPSRAVVFGAGKMACGLLGQLLSESGCQTTFVARRREVVDAINARGGYTLAIAGGDVPRVEVGSCAALWLGEELRIVRAVAAADVVFTALGIDNLEAVTPLIASALWERGQRTGDLPLNVIACENLPGAGAYLKHQVVSAGPPEDALVVERVGGFSAALTRRIMTGGGVEAGGLVFTVDQSRDLIVESQGLKPGLPELPGIRFTDGFPAMVMRKLFTLNCAHAVAAYLGWRAGCRTIDEAASHPRVAPVLRAAVDESRAALRAELPSQGTEIERESEEALERIANPGLADRVERVARGPRRKLSPRERLVGPAALALHHGLPHDNLCLGIAAALAYDDPSDPQAFFFFFLRSLR